MFNSPLWIHFHLYFFWLHTLPKKDYDLQRSKENLACNDHVEEGKSIVSFYVLKQSKKACLLRLIASLWRVEEDDSITN